MNGVICRGYAFSIGWQSEGLGRRESCTTKEAVCFLGLPYSNPKTSSLTPSTPFISTN